VKIISHELKKNGKNCLAMRAIGGYPATSQDTIALVFHAANAINAAKTAVRTGGWIPPFYTMTGSVPNLGLEPLAT
jgi:hypothetical protein